ncbi:MAG: PPC domain-containing protein, partial [Myxococcales bacterium]|nr:PPC domain-containing protein [Myxococcales bacterium]
AEGLNPISQQVGTDGSFCIDVPAPDNGVYAFRLTAHSRGVLSAATTVMTEKDGTAPTIPGARTCSGADPFGCGMQKEICDNNRDDDCNGVSDEKDPACSGCMSDYLEPNNDQSAPALEPGTYSALYLCPGESDYYGITVEEGDRIYLKVTFLHADGNIDAEILKPDGSVVAKGDSLDDDEIVSVTATEGGEYSARVFGSAGSATSSYGLFLSVTPGT